MEYYKLLQLNREPFSNSPDPEYFFHSRQHFSCLQKLELALRLKRGLNVVIGDVGTGKTTLGREVLRKFAKEPEFEIHLILDPSFSSALEFLRFIYRLICGRLDEAVLSPAELKEAVKQALFQKGVDQNKTVVLIIDEGQKIQSACLEILRELLNYETNAFKLLQIVIFAQLEFRPILQAYPNFADRINLLHELGPLNLKDTCEMIKHRIKLSSSRPKPLDIFTLPALWAIYRGSCGYPRAIINLCHQSVLAMIVQNRTRAGWSLVRACRKRLVPASGHRRSLLFAGTAVAIITGAMAIAFIHQHLLQATSSDSAFFKVPIQAFDRTTAGVISLSGKIEPPVRSAAAAAPAIIASPTQAAESTSSFATGSTAEIKTTNDLAQEKSIKENDARFPFTIVHTDPPAILGELPIKNGDTLFKMISKVYGSYRGQILQSIMEINPFIKNPNAIETGDSVLFPAIRFGPNPMLESCSWIVLEESDTLVKALARLDELEKSARVPAQMIGSWSPEVGLRFHLAIRGYFSNAQLAVDYLKTIPGDMASKARLVDNWPATHQLYANPYGGGAHNRPF